MDKKSPESHRQGLPGLVGHTPLVELESLSKFCGVKVLAKGVSRNKVAICIGNFQSCRQVTENALLCGKRAVNVLLLFMSST